VLIGIRLALRQGEAIETTYLQRRNLRGEPSDASSPQVVLIADSNWSIRISMADTWGETMRLIQAVVFLAFLGVVGLFAVQNTNVVTVNFWTWKLTEPTAMLAIAAYFLGMLSGWTVLAFVRRSIRRVAESPHR
jgi:uncharacterized integral membrane protein